MNVRVFFSRGSRRPCTNYPTRVFWARQASCPVSEILLYVIGTVRQDGSKRCLLLPPLVTSMETQITVNRDTLQLSLLVESIITACSRDDCSDSYSDLGGVVTDFRGQASSPSSRANHVRYAPRTRFLLQRTSHSGAVSVSGAKVGSMEASFGSTRSTPRFCRILHMAPARWLRPMPFGISDGRAGRRGGV